MALRDIPFSFGIDVHLLNPRFVLWDATGAEGTPHNPTSVTGGVEQNRVFGDYFISQYDIGSNRGVRWYCDTAGLGLSYGFYENESPAVAGGSGAYSVTTGVGDLDSNPIGGATVTITRNATRGVATSDDGGNVTLHGDAGTYTVVVEAPNFTTLVTTRTITGDNAGTLFDENLLLTPYGVIPAAPTDPAKGSLYGFVKLGIGSDFSGKIVMATLKGITGKGPFFISGTALLREETSHSTTTASDGSWSIATCFGNDVILDANGQATTEWRVTCETFHRDVLLTSGGTKNCMLVP